MHRNFRLLVITLVALSVPDRPIQCMQSQGVTTIIFTPMEARYIGRDVHIGTEYKFHGNVCQDNNLRRFLNSLRSPCLTFHQAIKAEPFSEFPNLVHALLLHFPWLVKQSFSGGETRGETPVMIAAHWGKRETLRKILSLHPNLELQANDRDGNTALGFAAKNGHVDCVSLLLQAGANPAQQNKIGNRPLCLAAGFGRTNVIQAFINVYQRYPDYLAELLNAPDAFCKNTLMWAAHMGHVHTVELLLRNHANSALAFEYDPYGMPHNAAYYAWIGHTSATMGYAQYGALRDYARIIKLLRPHKASVVKTYVRQNNPYRPVFDPKNLEPDTD